MVAQSGIDLRLGQAAEADMLTGFDEVIVATGVVPRDPEIAGQDGANVLSYIDVLRDKAPVGDRVVIIGAGGIGFDVAEFLVEGNERPSEDLTLWLQEWGVADPGKMRGGLASSGPQPTPPARQVVLLQRKAEKPGKRLGKTTGWIHRATLKMKGVEMRGGVNYESITPDGVEISVGEARENPRLIAADTVVLCAGQISERGLVETLQAEGLSPHVIGGADVATELDAKRAIEQGTRLAARL